MNLDKHGLWQKECMLCQARLDAPQTPYNVIIAEIECLLLATQKPKSQTEK
jgi:hypothetical protein